MGIERRSTKRKGETAERPFWMAVGDQMGTPLVAVAVVVVDDCMTEKEEGGQRRPPLTQK